MPVYDVFSDAIIRLSLLICEHMMLLSQEPNNYRDIRIFMKTIQADERCCWGKQQSQLRWKYWESRKSWSFWEQCGQLIFSVASYIYAMPKLVNYLNNCVIHENAPPPHPPRVQEFQAKL